LRVGAAQAAPTAPHATPGAEGLSPATGPERFWRAVPWQVQLAAVVLSGLVHYAAAPWSLLPRHELEFHDVDGTLTIPVDLVTGEATARAAAQPDPAFRPPAPEPLRTVSEDHEPALDASVRKTKTPRDAGEDPAEKVAADTAPVDAGGREGADAALASASEDAGTGGGRDAVGMIGAAGRVQAGPQNIVLTVNMAAIREHPEGKRLGPLLMAIPQWKDFIQGTRVNPLRDIDWISINGPALLHTEKDVILVRYAISDAEVDKAVSALSAKHSSGGRVDVGVPTVRAVRMYADNAERVFLRPQSHVLAVVPRDYAKTAAQILAKATVPVALKRADEALRLTLVHPHGPMRQIPESVTEVRLWIVPRSGDGGADVYGEGDTASASDGESAASALTRFVEDQNSFGVQLLTRGLLNGIEIRADGPHLRLHVSATRDQIEILLAFVGGRLGVDMPPLPEEPSTPSAPIRTRLPLEIRPP
jgi:hypothetical protein